MKRNQELNKAGQEGYRRWVAKLEANPEFQRIYAEEAAKSELWLQLVEARQAAGLTQRQLAKRLGVSQAQVARLEQRGYEDYTLNSLRRYVAALGDDFSLEVRVRGPEYDEQLAKRSKPARVSTTLHPRISSASR